MKRLLIVLSLLLTGASVSAQTKSTPPAVVKAIEGVTGKNFQPDTAFAALSEEDETLLAKEPVANWGLPQAAENDMSYYNLVIGTRSYQLVILKAPKAVFPTDLSRISPKAIQRRQVSNLGFLSPVRRACRALPARAVVGTGKR